MYREREITSLLSRAQYERAAWMAYEAARDDAKWAWLGRGGVKGDRIYEAARRLAWGEYELACAKAYLESIV